MATQEIKNVRLTFSTTQYLIFAVIGFVIWASGVVIVRVLGASFFDTSSILAVLYGVSVIVGVVIQFASPMLVRQAMKDTLIPLVFICGVALMLDGVAIGFTNVYSADTAMKVSVGGWLLWTFGTQLVITLFIVNRAHNS